MAGSRNEPVQLLELLQAAAGELKTTQADLEAERTKSKTLQASVERLEEQLRAAQRQLAAQNDPGNSVTEQRGRLIVTSPVGTHAVIEEKTGVVALDETMFQARLASLEEELERSKNAEQQIRERLVDVEAEYAEARLNGANTGGDDAVVAQLRQKLNVVTKELASVKEELTAVRSAPPAPPAVGASSPSSVAPSSSPSGLQGDPAKRITQLEGELSLVRSRRDDLNVELARVENDRKLARARIAELEAEAQKVRDVFEAEKRAALSAEVAKREAQAEAHQQALASEAAKRTEAESQHAKERERHQATAHKMLEGRNRTRELESQLTSLTTRITEVEGQLVRASEAARQVLTEKESSWVATRATLEAKAKQTKQQLDAAVAEQRHVEHQYEQLHKEMLTLLDQRDEARRELEALKSRPAR